MLPVVSSLLFRITIRKTEFVISIKVLFSTKGKKKVLENFVNLCLEKFSLKKET